MLRWLKHVDANRSPVFFYASMAERIGEDRIHGSAAWEGCGIVRLASLTGAMPGVRPATEGEERAGALARMDGMTPVRERTIRWLRRRSSAVDD